MKRPDQSMLRGPLFSNIVAYTVPIILTSILQLLFNAADLVVVGRFCGSISVAILYTEFPLRANCGEYFLISSSSDVMPSYP